MAWKVEVGELARRHLVWMCLKSMVLEAAVEQSDCPVLVEEVGATKTDLDSVNWEHSVSWAARVEVQLRQVGLSAQQTYSVQVVEVVQYFSLEEEVALDLCREELAFSGQ